MQGLLRVVGRSRNVLLLGLALVVTLTTSALLPTVLAGLTLAGIAASLYLQVREGVIAREQALRASHMELFKIGLDDPDLLRCWGDLPVDPQHRREHAYINLIVSHWQMMWAVGRLSEVQLRSLASKLFSEESGLRYWRKAGPTRAHTTTKRKVAKFHAILNEEFRSAPAADN